MHKTSKSNSGADESIRVEDRDGCRILYDAIPLHLMAKVLKGLPRDAVLDITAGNLLGAAMVVGLPEDLDRLKANTPRRTPPEPWAAKLGEAACKWVAEADVGISSNYLLHHFTGFNALAWLHRRNPAEDAKPGHPRDPADLRRCRALLLARPDFEPRLHEAAVCPEWKALIGRWDELCARMDEETPTWWEPSSGKAIKTGLLMDEILAAAHKSAPRP